MRKTLYLILATILLVGCVSQSEYDKLQEDNKKLKEENEIQFARIALLTSKVDELENEKVKSQIKKNRIKWYSDKQALNYVKDYYEFYNADSKYRGVKLRRVTDNEFRISLEECPKKGGFSDNDFFWTARVYRLTIDNKGNYDMN